MEYRKNLSLSPHRKSIPDASPLLSFFSTFHATAENGKLRKVKQRDTIPHIRKFKG
jgi:hypothetical protein